VSKPDLKQTQQRIIALAALGVLLTGLLVGLSTAVPLFHTAREGVEQTTLVSTTAQADALDNIVVRYRDIARQFTSRTEIRRRLQAYADGDLPMATLREYTEPRLRDPMGQSDAMAGLVRLGPAGETVVELGLAAVPEEPETVFADTLHTAMVVLEGQPLVRVAAAIPGRDGERIGTDVLYFWPDELAGLLAGSERFGSEAAQFLVEPAAGVRLGVEGGHEPVLAGIADAGRIDSVLPSLLEAEVGLSRLADDDGRVVLFHAPLVDSGWALVVEVPFAPFYAPAARQLVWPTVIVLFMVGLATLGMGHALRPLMRRVSRQTGQLRLAASVFDSAQEAIIITDQDHRVVQANRAFTEVTGLTGDEMGGRDLVAFMRPADSDNTYWFAQVREQLQQESAWSGEVWYPRATGEYFPAWQTISAVHDDAGESLRYIYIFNDISERKASEARIRRLAHYDVLTGLPNRALVTERLRDAVHRAVERRGAGHEAMLAVLFVDLDHFKDVNDALGHPVGDQLLQRVAQRLGHALRAQDTLGRLGGDEFLVLLEGLSRPEDAAAVARKIRRALAEPQVVEGQEIFIGASIGIALFPTDGRTPETLIQNADTAMYQAKDRGRNTFQFYTTELGEQTRERFDMEGGLRRAVERDELALHFQPQARLADDQVFGAEVLLRWHSPELGMVPPDRFIPIAEDSGLIHRIGHWVLEAACTQARRWEVAGQPLRISVNLSGAQIVHGDVVREVRHVLQQTGLTPDLLELEITEGFVIGHAERGAETLRQLRALGVSLAIDDFGTGYSSLSYLKRLPVQRLKIDRSFIRDLPDDADDCAIVSTVMAMAHSLGLEVVAEGVEVQAHQRYLNELGCQYYQGYLLSKPLPLAAFEAYLAGAQRG